MQMQTQSPTLNQSPYMILGVPILQCNNNAVLIQLLNCTEMSVTKAHNTYETEETKR
ncbi:hypothetical protein Sjap_019469 [Stephania japonica]|uniref:Uncharacterized protein n=1 Tax=Stephania japonica TaxID=461633 RepID=A0AAP0F1K3_9MAGN